MRSVPEEGQAGGDAPGGGYRPIRAILTGLSWNTSAQLATTALNVAAIPFLLLRLGVDQYGVYALVSSFRGLLSSLDGGLGPCASRYLAVFAGAGDRRRSASLLLTVLLLATVVTGAVGGAAAFFAPQITTVLHGSAGLRASATLLIRLFMPLLLVSTLRGIAARILSAEYRFGFLGTTGMLSNALYLGVAVVLVARGQGLMGLFWGRAAQEALLLVTTVAGVRRHIDLRDCRLMGRQEVGEVVRYAWRAQVAEVASSLGNEVNALVVGLLFPVRFVTYYSVGTSFAAVLAGFPVNAIGPIAVTLSRTFGLARFGESLAQLTVLQRLWVRATAAWPLVGAVAAYFGVVAWLGPQERLAGVVAAVLLVGQAPTTLAMVMDVFCKVVNRPGLESRYRAVATTVDLVLAVPLALSIGMLGVPLGVAAGQVAGTLYFLRTARREIDPRLRSFLAEAPKLAVAFGVVVTVLLELAASRVAPRGPAGLLLCAVPAAAALGVYALALKLRSPVPPVAPVPASVGARTLGPAGVLALGPGVHTQGDSPPFALLEGEREWHAAPGTRVPAGAPPAAAVPVPPAPAEAREEHGAPAPGGDGARPVPAGERGLPALVAQLRRTRSRLQAAQRSGVLVLVQLGSGEERGAGAGAGRKVLEDAARALALAIRDDDEIVPVGGSTLAVILELESPGRPGSRGARRVDLAAIEHRLADAVAAGGGVPAGGAAPQSVAVLL